MVAKTGNASQNLTMKFKLITFDPTKKKLRDFRRKYPVRLIHDYYQNLLEELFFIRNPKYRFKKGHETSLAKFIDNHKKGKKLGECGVWFYFDWKQTLVHYLEPDLHQEIRTARNKNMILSAEQQKFYNSTVAIAGLSVGSHAALSIALTGGAKNIKLADFDEISGSNLNRLPAGFSSIGTNKALYFARKIAEIDPYTNIFIYPEGLTHSNLDEFVDGDKADKIPASDLLIDQVDSLEMKIRLRLKARQSKTALLMATDVGEWGIVDIERYDLDQNLKIFNGLLGDFTMEEFTHYKPQEVIKLVTRIIGQENMPPRVQESLREIGKTLFAWPQLGSAASLSGAVLAYLTRHILLGTKIPSGRYSLEPTVLTQAATKTWLVKKTTRQPLRQIKRKK